MQICIGWIKLRRNKGKSKQYLREYGVGGAHRIRERINHQHTGCGTGEGDRTSAHLIH